MPTKMAEDFLTRREAAELAGVHINTVRLWESTGRVTVTKTNTGVVMIPRAEVEEIIEKRREQDQDEGERIAALEAENRVLREELAIVRGQFESLLDRIAPLTGTEEG